MAFTYAGDLSTTREKLRFAIGDTDTVNSDRQIFTDAELDGLIAAYGSDINYLAGKCMMAIASTMSRLATAIRVGGGDFSNDRKAVAKECREQAAAFFKQAAEVPYATEVALEDPDITRIENYEDPDVNWEVDLTDLND